MSRSTARTATRPVNEGKDLNSGKSTKDEPSSKGHQGESSLRKAEVAQLQSFVRARAKQVDSEINELREKLKSSNVKTTPSTLRLTQSVDNPLQRSAAQNNLVVSGKSLGTVDLQPSEVLQRSKIATSALEHKADALRFSSNLGNERNDTNHLSTILAKMRLSAEDHAVSASELKELMLPSDLMEYGEHCIRISEVTDVLQHDLLLPLTKVDQRLLIEHYGNEQGLINVRMMMVDAGLWPHDAHGSPSGKGSPELKSQAERSHYPSSPSIAAGRDSIASKTGAAERENTTRAANSRTETRDIFSETDMNMANLHTLHEMIMQEKEWDDENGNPNAGSLSMRRPTAGIEPNISSSPRQSSQLRSSLDRSIDDKDPPHSPRARLPEHPTTTSDRPVATADGSRDHVSSMGQEIDRLKALAEENSKLRNEISAFDSEFFEELEDLKYRYMRLQEIVGEDPMAPLFDKSQNLSKAQGKSHSGKDVKLPLGRLAWSVRNSMRAMDRASEDSPLVTGPRMASSYTYAPGDEHEEGGVRSLSANRAEYRDYLHDSVMGAAKGPEPYNPMLLSRKAQGEHFPDGGVHGIGAGKYSQKENEFGGTFANLCERRLAFELSSMRNPTEATNEMIHRVTELADKNAMVSKDFSSGSTFITVPQLRDIVSRMGMAMSSQEVDILATGFASNGKGGIDAVEFCDMVRMLVYNLIGAHEPRHGSSNTHRHHDTHYGGGERTSKSRSKDPHSARRGSTNYNEGDNSDDEVDDKFRDENYKRLIMDVCEGIITFDKRAVLGSSTNLVQTLMKPFVEQDYKGAGVLKFHEFCTVIKDIGAMLSQHEYRILAAPFVQLEHPAESAYPSSNLNHIKSFRDAKLTGSLRGKAASQRNFGDFLTEHGISMSADGQNVLEDSLIKYTTFVEELAQELNAMLDKRGGLPLNPRMPWVLKEFEFVDVLISQLEAMRSTARRKVLITLQYALQNADTKQTGELDGFALLTALINCGFRLQRYHRVQLLKAAEEFGGQLEYSRLILTLLQTAIDWTQSERGIMQKILKAMGITVYERRSWLARLKKELMSTAAKSRVKRVTKKQIKKTAKGQTHLDDDDDLLEWSKGLHDDEQDGNFVVTPSSFLHVLRECQIHLSPEEEATLLDCLDTERIAKQQALHLQNLAEARSNRLVWNRDDFSVPMVDFQSFVHFCSRHCGSWMESKPELRQELEKAIESIHVPLQALQEFITLLHSFDETKKGFVSYRAFLICCHRARLFANLDEAFVNQLADILSLDGAGEIEYKHIALQLRGICSAIAMQNMDSSLSVMKQLVHNASDEQETLLPLRNWLILHSDMQAMILTTRELNALLREFSVVYRPEDLETTLLEIGREVDSNAISGQGGDSSRKHYMDNIGRSVQVVDTKKLLALVMKQRDNWTRRNPRLARYLLTSLNRMHANKTKSRGGSGSASSSNDQHAGEGAEMAALEEILSRIKAFAAVDEDQEEDDNPVHTHTDGTQEKVLLIDQDIFHFIVKSMGLELSREDLLFLADASDVYPEAKRIAPELLFDVISFQRKQGVDEDEVEVDELTEAALFALHHLQDLIWKLHKTTRRSEQEWISDMFCLFKGFNPHQQGFMTMADFHLALDLLGLRVSTELLKDIPWVGRRNRGYVQYEKVLHFVLHERNKNASGLGVTTKSMIKEGNAHSSESLLHHLTVQEAEKEKQKKQKLTIKNRNSSINKVSPVAMLLRVVRKQVCSEFIVSESNLEEAWMEMLRVFQRFDNEESNTVTPRDFCLAVSVLLEGDDIALSKQEWEEIIDYFAVPENADENERNQKGLRTQRKRKTVELAVDYMLFCEMVLDPTEVGHKLEELKLQRLSGNASSNKLDRSKRQFLSTSASTKDRDNSTDKQRMQQQTMPRAMQAKMMNGGKGGEESIESRFEKASERQKTVSRQGKEYGDHSRSSNTAASRDDVDNIGRDRIERGTAPKNSQRLSQDSTYRVGRTQGQSSRDSAAVHKANTSRVPKFATVTVPPRQIYDARRDIERSKSPSTSVQQRFNYTT